MTDFVHTAIKNKTSFITLDRPKALNSLSLEMIRTITAALLAWRDDDAVQAVVIHSSSEKAFCAGGDIRFFHEAGTRTPQGGSALLEDFFTEEYALNHLIHHYPKPYIALMDGIVMGGGVGLSVHGPYRVATEKTLFAMPETGIGLIPDVGGTHLLGRMRGQLGVFLGLLGERLKAADCLYAGIATHYAPSSKIEELTQALADEAGPVDDILARFTTDAGEAPLAARQADIDRYFAGETVEEIVAALGEGDAWAAEMRERLLGLSPTSLKLTLRAVRAGASLDLADCLRQEFRLVSHIGRGHDFYEGVRAQLVDKDRSPKWNPASLEDVGEEVIEAHFAAPEGGELQVE